VIMAAAYTEPHGTVRLTGRSGGGGWPGMPCSTPISTRSTASSSRPGRGSWTGPVPGHGEGEDAQRDQLRVVAAPVEAAHNAVCACGDVDGGERRRDHPGRSPPAAYGCRPPERAWLLEVLHDDVGWVAAGLVVPEC
jgi:hypothetical protein